MVGKKLPADASPLAPPLICNAAGPGAEIPPPCRLACTLGRMRFAALGRHRRPAISQPARAARQLTRAERARSTTRCRWRQGVNAACAARGRAAAMLSSRVPSSPSISSGTRPLSVRCHAQPNATSRVSYSLTAFCAGRAGRSRLRRAVRNRRDMSWPASSEYAPATKTQTSTCLFPLTFPSCRRGRGKTHEGGARGRAHHLPCRDDALRPHFLALEHDVAGHEQEDGSGDQPHDLPPDHQ